MSKKNSERRKLITIRVTKQTFDHLCAMAELQGKKHAGEVVDKLVRNIRIALREGRYIDQRRLQGRKEQREETV